MPRSRTYYELRDALGEEGCPICRLALKAVHDWLDSVAYEMVNDPGVRDRLRASRGFCNTHAYEWLSVRNLLGTAIIYEDVLKNVSGRLRELSYRRRDLLSSVSSLLGGDEQSALPRDGRCPACEAQAEAERRAAATLAESLGEEEVLRAYTSSSGLCLQHLSLALSSAPSRESFDSLVRAVLSQQERLTSQLREIIRRHDYRFRDKPAGEERGATVRAIRHVVGEPGVRGTDL